MIFSLGIVRRGRRVLSRLHKGTWGGLALLLALVVAFAFWRRLIPEAETLTLWARDFLPGGVGGGVVYVFAVAVLMALAVPRQLAGFVGGCVFGALPGALLSTLGATLGCMAAFTAARRWGRSRFERRYGNKTAGINAALRAHPFLIALLVRLFPSGNNWLCTVAAGVSRIPARPFFLGSCLGYFPQNFVFSLLGSGVRMGAGWRVGLALALLCVAGSLAWRLCKRYGAQSAFRPCHEPDA